MASAGSATDRPYAAFLALPSSSLRLPQATAAGNVPASLPHRLAVAGYEDETPSAAPEAFDVAQRYIEDHTAWEAEQAGKDADRAERREEMRQRTGSAPSRAAAVDPLGARAAPPAAGREEKIRSVSEATGLDAERARYYLDINDWQVDKAVLNATEIGAPIAPGQRTDEALLELRLPDGRVVKHGFQVTSSVFDVYQKVYELVTNKELAFTMTVTGPRREPWAQQAAPRGAQRLDGTVLGEETFGLLLSQVGLVSGSSYEVDVQQS